MYFFKLGEKKMTDPIDEFKITVPATPTEDRPRQRIFSRGRCWKHITSCNAICKCIVGLYAIGASGGMGYIINDGLINPDPDSMWGRMNHTAVDYGMMGGASIVLDTAFMIFALLGAGLITKTCYDGIKEGRVQRGQTPLLDNP